MIAGRLKEALKRDSIVQVFPRVKLEAHVNAGFVEGIEDRRPACCQFAKSLFHQFLGPLRPGIEVRPGQRAENVACAASPRLRLALAASVN